MENKDLNTSDLNASIDSNASGSPGEESVSKEEVPAEATWLEGVMDEGAMGMLLDGGAFMWPLLILAIIGLAVVIERFRSLKMLDADDDSLRRGVIDLLAEDKTEEALEYPGRIFTI